MVINELLDVLFFRNQFELYEKISSLEKLYYPNDPQKYEPELNRYICDYIQNKENLFRIVEDYHQNGLPIWYDQAAAQNCDNIDVDNIPSLFINGSYANGEKIYDLYERMKKKWAFHLDDYADLVNFKDNINILELATGAGLGTCAVMKALKHESRLVSIDIDFPAAKNADGLARYLRIDDRACGMNASFWNLPFESNLFDVVCTHYGLDESRELPTTLAQISKVLKPNGKFIGVCRKFPYDRHKRILDLFGINKDETNALAEKVRLYSGFENLTATASKCHLKMVKYIEYTQQISHDRILFAFTKDV